MPASSAEGADVFSRRRRRGCGDSLGEASELPADVVELSDPGLRSCTTPTSEESLAALGGLCGSGGSGADRGSWTGEPHSSPGTAVGSWGLGGGSSHIENASISATA